MCRSSVARIADRRDRPAVKRAHHLDSRVTRSVGDVSRSMMGRLVLSVALSFHVLVTTCGSRRDN